MRLSPSSSFLAGLAVVLTLCSGCGLMADLAYDSAVAAERARCDRLESTPERQACQEKLRTAARRPDDSRRFGER